MARNTQSPPPPTEGGQPQPVPFTRQDAENIIIIARRAPLQNSDEADALRASLSRFANFVVANVK